MSLIRRAEASEDIDLGKRIHEFRYEELDVRLDRDIAGLYRVTVKQGKERLYSFTVVCPPKDYAMRDGSQLSSSNQVVADTLTIEGEDYPSIIAQARRYCEQRAVAAPTPIAHEKPRRSGAL